MENNIWVLVAGFAQLAVDFSLVDNDSNVSIGMNVFRDDGYEGFFKME